MRNSAYIFFVIFTLIFAKLSFASVIKDKVGVDEKLGSVIPRDAVFYDSQSNRVVLGDLMKKPTVIDFAYYKCTGICTPIMSELANVVNKVDLTPGKDYNIITISFNPDETPKDAAEKKMQIDALLKDRIPTSSWKFLTGDSLDIKKVADAAGFHFERQGSGYIHTGALIFVSSKGKICRYLRPDFNYRGDFFILPFDFKMALLEASKGQEIPVIDNALKYCFKFQPKDQAYVFDVFKVSGITVILTVLFVFWFVVKKPKKKIKKIGQS